ncbi:MAG TPA: hypothetical protein VFP30_02090 [Candidatus Limnocylindria bacterium]|nr:hypothetical protein [Candidatus Limnocylindria bacterium]
MTGTTHRGFQPKRPAMSGESRCLRIERSEQRLDVYQQRLELDREHDPRRRMERKQVDPSAFAPPAVADLDLNEPAPSLQPLLHRCTQGGMPFVEQPIQLGTVPKQPQVDPAAQGLSDRLDRGEG